MKLVYKITGEPVKVGDMIFLPVQAVNGSPKWECEVLHIREPLTIDKLGGVTMSHPHHAAPQLEYIPAAVGAKWLDQQE